MKAIPSIYPFILILLVIFLIFVSAYSIAESATAELNSEILVDDNRGSMFSWYEETAIFICPLH